MKISIEDLTFTYHGSQRPGLRDFRGRIEEGTFVVVMGHGGAGKSTLCYCLNGLIPRFFRGQYQGHVFVDDSEVASRSIAEMSRTVGVVLQDFEAQLFSTNVELEMAFGPENHGLPRAEIERRIQRYLSFVKLETLRHREPSSLSGGQKQRLAIGSVLALEPRVLVMDEPTTDLDPSGCEEVLSVVRDVRAQGRILLLVDHEPETAIKADQVWLMRDGQMVMQGPPSQVLMDSYALERSGINALPMVKLFQAMGWKGPALTVENAVALIERHHLASPRELNLPKEPLKRANNNPILEAEDLSYTYPFHSVDALKGINLSIYEGEFIAILGQNGSGKTTLAKHFNGLLRPTSGRMLVRGKPTTEYNRRELARLVGYVFQNPDHQIFARTVREEIAFGPKSLGQHFRDIKSHVAEVLEVVGLQGYEEQGPFTLTKGERQRVAVASVLAAQPHVIILDEPTTGLDYPQQRNMMEMLRRLNRSGHTVIIITHSMWAATEYADRTILLKEGTILSDGQTRAVFANEALLEDASLRAPSLVRLSNWLGTQAVTVDELVRELKEGIMAKSQAPIPK